MRTAFFCVILALSGCRWMRNPVTVSRPPQVVTELTVEKRSFSERVYYLPPGCELSCSVFHQIAQIPGVGQVLGRQPNEWSRYRISVTKAPQYPWDMVQPMILRVIKAECGRQRQ